MKTTIDMAREAGSQKYGPLTRNWSFELTQLKAFEALVRADERKQIALDKKAENARELGLDYEPVKPRGEATLAQQEPVAVHQFRKRGCSDWYDGYPDHTDGRGPYQARTLYTSPPAQRKPLTDEEIKELYGDDDNFRMTKKYVIAFARAIEAAHGIGEKK